MLAANSTAAMLTGTTSPGLERLVHKAAAHINYLQADQLELHRNSELVSQYHKWFLQAPLGFHILDSDGVIQDVNSKWLEMLGYQRAQVIGQPIFNFIIPGQRENARARFEARKAFPNQPEQWPAKVGDRLYVRSDGSAIPIETMDMVFTYRDGSILEIQTAFLDLRPSRLATAAQFAGIFYHGMKNYALVLESIQLQSAALDLECKALIELINYFQLAKLPVPRSLITMIDNKQKDREHLNRELDQTIRLLKDTAMTALSMAKAPNTAKKAILVKSVLDQACNSLLKYAQDHVVALDWDMSELGETDAIVIAEPTFLAMIHNLVMNAIEASTGSVRHVNVKVRKADSKIVVSVVDRGSGMTEAKRLELLSGSPTSTKTNGSGFGWLQIRLAVQSANGTVSIRSLPNVGSDISLTFPATTAKPEVYQPVVAIPPTATADSNLARIRIWIAEDEPHITHLVTSQLAGRGFTNVRVFGDGEALLAEMRRPEGLKPHIIVTDQTMPRMKGTELVRALITQLGIAGIPPTIVWSAAYRDDMGSNEIAALIDAYPDRLFYAVKPVSDSLISQLIAVAATIELTEADLPVVIANQPSEEEIQLNQHLHELVTITAPLLSTLRELLTRDGDDVLEQIKAATTATHTALQRKLEEETTQNKKVLTQMYLQTSFLNTMLRFIRVNDELGEAAIEIINDTLEKIEQLNLAIQGVTGADAILARKIRLFISSLGSLRQP